MDLNPPGIVVIHNATWGNAYADQGYAKRRRDSRQHRFALGRLESSVGAARVAIAVIQFEAPFHCVSQLVGKNYL
jgi:hypothetical protein